MDAALGAPDGEAAGAGVALLDQPPPALRAAPARASEPDHWLKLRFELDAQTRISILKNNKVFLFNEELQCCRLLV